MRGRIFAWLNLAWHFAVHLVRRPLRILRGEDEAERFLGVVGPEGYTPLTPDERARYPEFMNCIGCGLCSLACPELREAPAPAWDEALSFVTGPGRSIDNPGLADGLAARCERCPDCAAVCPWDVPVPRLAAMVRRMAEAGPEVTRS